jgi:hypothetical protein
MSGLRRYRYITILYLYRVYADIGQNLYRRLPDIGYTRCRVYADVGILRYYPEIGVQPMSGIPDIGYASTRHRVNTDIGCTPISGIIEISADIGVNITIYRYRRTIRRYRCSARIQMLPGCASAAGSTWTLEDMAGPPPISAASTSRSSPAQAPRARAPNATSQHRWGRAYSNPPCYRSGMQMGFNPPFN